MKNVFAQFMMRNPSAGAGAPAVLLPPSSEADEESAGAGDTQRSRANREAAAGFLELEAAGGGRRRRFRLEDSEFAEDAPNSEDEAFISASPVKRSSRTYHFAVDAARLNGEAADVLNAAERTEAAAAAAIEAAAKARAENNPFAKAAKAATVNDLAGAKRKSGPPQAPGPKRSATGTNKSSSYFGTSVSYSNPSSSRAIIDLSSPAASPPPKAE